MADINFSQEEQSKKFHRFLELPRDLVKLLMIKYFDPLSLLRCLRVCKDFKNLLSNINIKDLRIKVVKQIAYEKQIAWLDDGLKQCELCGEEIRKGRLPRHLEKHQETLRNGGVVQRCKPSWMTLELCKLCAAPFPNYGPHKIKGCPLEIIDYNYYKLVEANGWAELLHCQSMGYRIKEKYNKVFKCKRCKELFSPYTKTGKNGFHDHLMYCKFGMDIIIRWRITMPFLKGKA